MPLHRIGRLCAAVALLTLACDTGSTGAHATARDQLAQAIAAAPGTYLVYTFGAGSPAPMRNAAGVWYEMDGGGRLTVIKDATQRLSPRLLVDTHQGPQARCEHMAGARTAEGLPQAAEIYPPEQAWQMLGRPALAVNANYFDVRPQRGGSWKSTGCSSPLGAYVDNTGDLGRTNMPVTGTPAYAGKRALSGGDEVWTALSTLIIPVGGAPFLLTPAHDRDYDVATPVITDLVDKGAKFVAVSGVGLLRPGESGQLNDPGPAAARTAIAYAGDKDEMYVFQGGHYTPDQIQDLFRALAGDTALLLDGGGSSAIVLRRDGGAMWAGASAPPGSCDTPQTLCDAGEPALPAWLAFD